ncbi:MAG: ERCC4 domain-containing protein [Planctomycetes bacterium]|nr:ERCC4 domain-containing protein [Planctomycetota bacterium]
MSIAPAIVVDSREQQPLIFANLPTEPGTLDAGDYSIAGLTHLVAVERKSLPDLLSCVGRERARFVRELRRLLGYRFRALVIEASLPELEAGEWRSKLKPSHVLGSLTAWQARYSLPVVFAGNRAAAGRYVEKFLYQCARTVAMELDAARAFVAVATPGDAPVPGGTI